MKRFLTALALVGSVAHVQGLYFYMETNVPKCFYEDLPKDTLVVGQWAAEHYDSQLHGYSSDPTLSISITVDEVFDNDHRVISQRGSVSPSRFTFTAADAGEHRICFTATSNSPHASSQGWLRIGQHAKAVKFSLDLAIGATSAIESNDKGKMEDLVQKVKDLNGRMQDIKREQVYQREREAEFRDQSESVNSRVVKWTLIQLAVLGITCAWQLSHLRAFFIKQKLT